MSGEAISVMRKQKQVPLILNCDQSASVEIQKLMTENGVHMFFGTYKLS